MGVQTQGHVFCGNIQGLEAQIEIQILQESQGAFVQRKKEMQGSVECKPLWPNAGKALGTRYPAHALLLFLPLAKKWGKEYDTLSNGYCGMLW